MPKPKLVLIENARAASWPAVPEARGYLVTYRRDEVNWCPGCGRTHWFVGRLSAECAFCGTAVPLAGAM